MYKKHPLTKSQAYAKGYNKAYKLWESRVVEIETAAFAKGFKAGFKQHQKDVKHKSLFERIFV